MVNIDILTVLEKGTNVWNNWRKENPLTYINLSGANLTYLRYSLEGVNLSHADLDEAKLEGINLNGADLSLASLDRADLYHAKLVDANLTSAKFREADLRGADLSNANLREADLRKVNLSNANLNHSNLDGADLRGADFTNVDLSDATLNQADLSKSRLIDSKLNKAILNGCRVFGISAWGLIGLEEAEQSNLIITPENESNITVDNLEVAQFIYLMLHSEKIRNVIDTLTSKVVLILGRFSGERKEVLDAIREELRKRNYLPILFDFDKPASRDITETISTLAHMARFVIADITEAKSIPQELALIVPNLPSVPVQPILLSSTREYGMFEHFKSYGWVLETYYYNNRDDLLNSLESKVIAPAEQKAKQLQKR